MKLLQWSFTYHNHLVHSNLPYVWCFQPKVGDMPRLLKLMPHEALYFLYCRARLDLRQTLTTARLFPVNYLELQDVKVSINKTIKRTNEYKLILLFSLLSIQMFSRILKKSYQFIIVLEIYCGL